MNAHACVCVGVYVRIVPIKASTAETDRGDVQRSTRKSAVSTNCVLCGRSLRWAHTPIEPYHAAVAATSDETKSSSNKNRDGSNSTPTHATRAANERALAESVYSHADIQQQQRASVSKPGSYPSLGSDAAVASHRDLEWRALGRDDDDQGQGPDDDHDDDEDVHDGFKRPGGHAFRAADYARKFASDNGGIDSREKVLENRGKDIVKEMYADDAHERGHGWRYVPEAEASVHAARRGSRETRSNDQSDADRQTRGRYGLGGNYDVEDIDANYDHDRDAIRTRGQTDREGKSACANEGGHGDVGADHARAYRGRWSADSAREAVDGGAGGMHDQVRGLASGAETYMWSPYIHTYMHVCVCVCVKLNAYAYTYTHTCTHIYMYM
jgi:hypothetical protein